MKFYKIIIESDIIPYHLLSKIGSFISTSFDHFIVMTKKSRLQIKNILIKEIEEDDFIIKEIKNIKDDGSKTLQSQWINEQLLKLDIERYEKNNQEYLQNLYKELEDLESGVEVSGNKQQKNYVGNETSNSEHAEQEVSTNI